MDRNVTENINGSNASLELDALLRAFPDTLFSLDLEGRILDYKAAKSSAFHVSPEQFLGHLMQEILPVEAVLKFEHALQGALKTSRVVSMEYCLTIQARAEH